MAARGSDLPGVTTAKMMEQMIEGYDQAFAERADTRKREGKRPESVRIVMRQAVDRTWKALAKERIEDTKPAIPIGKRFWRLTREEQRAINELFQTEARAPSGDLCCARARRAPRSKCSTRPIG